MLQGGIADGVSRREAAKYRRYDGQGRRILRPTALQRFSKVLLYSVMLIPPAFLWSVTIDPWREDAPS